MTAREKLASLPFFGRKVYNVKVDKKKRNLGQFFLNFALSMLCFLIVFPFILVVSISFSNSNDIVNFGYSVIPRNFDLSAYRYIFGNPWSVISAYRCTFIFSSTYMFFSTFLMVMVAYPLSRINCPWRQQISFYLYFTMLFSGGLVPTYILLTQYLNLDDTIWIYILPSLISPWSIFMIRTFFQGIPTSIVESAYIDGAGEYAILFRIVMPLSKSVLATVALFGFLAKWNDWYTSMLYINKEELVSLQYLLQRIMLNIRAIQQNNDIAATALFDNIEIPSETIRMAMAVIVAGPALIVFPFFQKYFVKGIAVGSVKG